MRALTLVLPHFCNLGMLAEHQVVWGDYQSELRAHLHVIVVDDCSPKGHQPVRKSLTLESLASLRLYRLTEKARWNWLACRNLGVSEATTEWVLLTDIDHVLPEDTLRRILVGDLDPRNVYRLSRVDAPHPWPYTLAECPPYKMHPNTWLMTRKMYDAIGGYDERLSGCYGTDGEFRDRVHDKAMAVVALPDVLIRYPREIIADASTTIYTRKNDPVNDADLLRRREARSLITNWKPLRGSFPWEPVAAVQMEATCSTS
jgi:hypothetical protein